MSKIVKHTFTVKMTRVTTTTGTVTVDAESAREALELVRGMRDRSFDEISTDTDEDHDVIDENIVEEDEEDSEEE